MDDELGVTCEGLEFFFCGFEEHDLPVSLVVVEGGEEKEFVVREISEARDLGVASAKKNGRKKLHSGGEPPKSQHVF